MVMLELGSFCKACTIKNWVNECFFFKVAVSTSQKVGIQVMFVFVQLLLLGKKEHGTSLEELMVTAN